MKCPKCKETFDLNFYESHGRCSECGYSLAEDATVVNAILRDSKKKTSKYTKMESVSSSVENEQKSHKATVTVKKSVTKKQSAADQNTGSEKIKKVIPSVPKASVKEEKRVVSKKEVPKKIVKEKSQVSASDVSTNVEQEKVTNKRHSREILKEENPSFNETLSYEDTDEFSSFEFEEDIDDSAAFDVPDPFLQNMQESNVDKSIKEMEESFTESKGDCLHKKKLDTSTIRDQNTETNADDNAADDSDEEYSSFDLKNFIKKKLKKKLQEDFPLVFKILNLFQKKADHDETRKKKDKKQKKGSRVKETDTEFNSNLDGYYNDVTFGNEPTADKIPFRSIGRVLLVLVFLWLFASFLIYYA